MPLVHQSYLFMRMNAYIYFSFFNFEKRLSIIHFHYIYTGKRLEENLSKHLNKVRAQFWNYTTMGCGNKTMGKMTTYHSAEMLQLVENLLQNNDKFHWFSSLLKHRKLSCALTAKINCKGIHWNGEIKP